MLLRERLHYLRYEADSGESVKIIDEYYLQKKKEESGTKYYLKTEDERYGLECTAVGEELIAEIRRKMIWIEEEQEKEMLKRYDDISSLEYAEVRDNSPRLCI